MQVWSLGQEDHLEKEMATHSSFLSWRIPWTEEVGELWPIGSQKIKHNWCDFIHLHTYTFKNDYHNKSSYWLNCTKIVFILCDLSFTVLFEIRASVIHGYFDIQNENPLSFKWNVLLLFEWGCIIDICGGF